jgi:hypothetical protein
VVVPIQNYAHLEKQTALYEAQHLLLNSASKQPPHFYVEPELHAGHFADPTCPVLDPTRWNLQNLDPTQPTY